MKFLNMILSIIIFALLTSCAHSAFNSGQNHKMTLIKFNDLPKIGTTLKGQNIFMGGLSSLTFIKKENNKLFFWAITDRGPNAEFYSYLDGVRKIARPFLLPDFSPLLVELGVDLSTATASFEKLLAFKHSDNSNITGLPPLNSKQDFKNNHQRYEIAVDIFEKPILRGSGGMDSEGFCKFQNTYLVSEEYGPDLLQFDSNLKLINRWTAGRGLPKELGLRKLNRGLEGLACDDRFAYLLMQSPLPSKLPKDLNKIRIIQFNPLTQATEKEFFYPVEASVADKLGDLALIENQKFIIIEQNGTLGSENGIRKIYQVDLALADRDGVLSKKEILDLNRLGLDFVEKIEGITIIDKNTIAFVIDNDFGLNSTPDKKDSSSYIVIIYLNRDLN